MKGEKSRALELAEKVIRKDPLDVTKVSLVSGGRYIKYKMWKRTTQFLDLRRSDSLATARQAMEGQIFYF